MFTFPILADVQLLHIPDGFLSLPMAIIAWVITAVILMVAVRQAQELFDERLIPLAGIMAAFIFAGQMLNFPVAGGTSGHLIGAALAVIVLGPWLGILAMTAVIALQALLFQDGGLVVMGANILIMGIVPAFVGYGLYRLAAQRERRIRLAVTAAFITALLLGFSGASAFRFVIPAMLGVHALIGVGEALITIAALSFITQARPDLLADKKTTGRGRGWVIGGVIISLLVVLLAPLASAFPDGLEWVAEQQGFIDAAQEAPYQILPDYTVPGLGETAVSTILAGIIGAVIVLLITAGVTRALRQSGRAQ
jgi:cobalt/nickel transport system permease protein